MFLFCPGTLDFALTPPTNNMLLQEATRHSGSVFTVTHQGNETTAAVAVEDSVMQSGSIPSHPLGVKPLGNQYLSDGPKARRNIGSWQSLPDEILMVVLEHFEKPDLLNLGHTCKFLYALCHSDELWKALFLR